MCVAVSARTQVFNLAGYTTASQNFTEQPVAYGVKNRQLYGGKMTMDDGHGKIPLTIGSAK